MHHERPAGDGHDRRQLAADAAGADRAKADPEGPSAAEVAAEDAIAASGAVDDFKSHGPGFAGTSKSYHAFFTKGRHPGGVLLP